MKVIAIASVGGHWIQLLRLKKAFVGCELEFISTKQSFATMVPDHTFHAITDANRKNIVGLIKAFREVYAIISKVRPQVVITTGAAPGLMGLMAGKFIGAKTIWVDSIANVETLSMSGKIASIFADRTYTQWPDLATSKLIYAGNILS